MPDANDMDLVREFARHNSETAFAELVQRHLNLVYSVALRYTANPGDAQDVAQAVFIILARKAARLNDRTVLTGWLYETTRLTAAGWLRTQKRRRAHEQEAYMQSTLDQSGTDNLWRQLAPHLEAAMSRLNARERTLLALRFYENKTGAEAAALLGIREETAYKRTARALEKLHRFFNQRGISSTTAILANEISAHSLLVAPAGLAKSVTLVAMTKGAAASGSTLTLIKGALKIMAWTKAKTTIVIGVSLLIAAGTTSVSIKKIKEYQANRDSWRIPRFAPDTVSKATPQVRILPTKFKPPVYGALTDGTGKWAGVRAKVIDMVRIAYHWPPGRIVFPAGEPQERYDFAATLPDGAEKALQREIEKTLGLVGRPETRDTDVLVLKVRTPNAPGLKPYVQGPVNVLYDIRGRIICKGFPISAASPAPSFCLTKYLEIFLQMPVIDETGLAGNYDIDFKWSERGEEDPNHDAMKKVLLDQLGLELVPANMPIEMLVVEKAK